MARTTHYDDRIEVTGKHTNATILTTSVDDKTVEQVQKMVDHPGFRNNIVVMPDGHWCPGAVVGFSMELDDLPRISPNTVGVDIGCGMMAQKIDLVDSALDSEEALESIDTSIRANIPMGVQNFGDSEFPSQSYHLLEDFPWGEFEMRLERASDCLGEPISVEKTPSEFVADLSNRVGYDSGKIIDSMGTLGGGNHFIELARDYFDETWLIVHSGSRGIGKAISEHHMDRAHEACDERANEVRAELEEIDSEYYHFDLGELSDAELLDRIRGRGWQNMDAVAQDYRDTDPKAIERYSERLNNIGRLVTDNENGDPLDFLTGSEAVDYVVDLIWAQLFARENRRQMGTVVKRVLGATEVETIESPHNLIDFDDGYIRKGATRVREGERAIIPFNMSKGSIVVEGRGVDEWNQTAPHGAGRPGPPSKAVEGYTLDDYSADMEGVFSSVVSEKTLHESPQAYKDPEVVLSRIAETADVVNQLTPILNIKAEGWS